MERIGVVAIIVSDRGSVPAVQEVLSSHAQIIVGRMGIPDRQTAKNIIALIVKGQVDEISALTGALGRIQNVSAKSVLTATDK